MKKYLFHPAANIFPLNADCPEFDVFVESIKRDGLLYPIVLHEGKILDGRRRYLACQAASIEPMFVKWDGRGLPVDYVWAVNALRRQLTPSQLAIASLTNLAKLLGLTLDDRNWNGDYDEDEDVNGDACSWTIERQPSEPSCK